MYSVGINVRLFCYSFIVRSFEIKLVLYAKAMRDTQDISFLKWPLLHTVTEVV